MSEEVRDLHSTFDSDQLDTADDTIWPSDFYDITDLFDK